MLKKQTDLSPKNCGTKIVQSPGLYETLYEWFGGFDKLAVILVEERTVVPVVPYPHDGLYIKKIVGIFVI